MLILKPKGRGRWAPVTVTVQGKHAHVLGDLLAHGQLRPGATFELGGVRWRVCEVRS